MPNVTVDGDTLETTAWFSAFSRPSREGVYQRRGLAGPFSCWNGRTWNAEAASPAEAAGRTEPSVRQWAPWRGLVAQHDAPCATCGGRTIVDRGVDAETDADLIDECPDC